MALPKIDLGSCVGCGNWVEACTNGVLVVEDELARVANPDECIECGLCAEECPTDAIAF